MLDNNVGFSNTGKSKIGGLCFLGQLPQVCYAVERRFWGKRYKTLAARKAHPQSRLYQCFLSPYCVTKSMKKAGKKRFASYSPFSAPCMAATLFQFVGWYCFMSSYLLRFHFLLCRRFPNGRGSLLSSGETAHFTRLSVQTIYAASAAEEGGGQHVAEENSQLRGIERIDCEGE